MPPQYPDPLACLGRKKDSCLSIISLAFEHVVCFVNEHTQGAGCYQVELGLLQLSSLVSGMNSTCFIRYTVRSKLAHTEGIMRVSFNIVMPV